MTNVIKKARARKNMSMKCDRCGEVFNPEPPDEMGRHKPNAVILVDKNVHDAWDYTHSENLPVNPLYCEGQKRGYKLHARMVWDKENGVAPAFTVRFSHEYLLWFYKPGKMLMPRKETRGKYTTILREPATYHSHKPQCAYKMLEDMFPTAKKIELFARNHRDGWDAFGNQIEEV